VRELVKSICTSRAIVWRRLTGFLGFVVKHLHWFPTAWQMRNDKFESIGQTNCSDS
jgi:hypothetical protein